MALRLSEGGPAGPGQARKPMIVGGQERPWRQGAPAAGWRRTHRRRGRSRRGGIIFLWVKRRAGPSGGPGRSREVPVEPAGYSPAADGGDSQPGGQRGHKCRSATGRTNPHSPSPASQTARGAPLGRRPRGPLSRARNSRRRAYAGTGLAFPSPACRVPWQGRPIRRA